MGLLDYKRFLIKESDGQTYINADDTPSADSLGSIPKSDSTHDKKLQSIKSTLQEEAYDSISKVINERLPVKAQSSTGNIMKLIKNSLKVDDLPMFLTKLTDEPIKLTAESFSQKINVSQTLASHYGNVLPADVFKQIGKENSGDSGPYEIVLSIFSTLRKQGTAGDLVDTNGNVIEVKGASGRLKTKTSPGSSQPAQDAIIKILGISSPSEKDIGTRWIDAIFPAVKSKKFTSEEAKQFVTALSQYPKDWSTHRDEAARLIEKGISTANELLKLYVAIQLLSYADSSTDKFSYILNFTNGYDMCKVFKIAGSSLSELMTSASELSIAGWGIAADRGAGIGISVRK